MNKTQNIFFCIGFWFLFAIIVFIILIHVPNNSRMDKSSYIPKENLKLSQQKIPRKIHQIWTYKKLPKKFKKIQQHLLKQNPEYSYHLYDDKDMDNFVKDNYPEYYESYSSISSEYVIAKGDFFRYMIIYHQGGVYFDMKSGHQTPLRDVIKPSDEMLIPRWNNIATIFPRIDWPAQWVIISVAKHPMLKLVLDEVNNRLKNANSSHYGWRGVLWLTGPMAYMDVINKNKDMKNITYIKEPNGFVYNYMEKNDAEHLACTLYSGTGIGKCKHKMGKTRYTLKTSPVVIK